MILLNAVTANNAGTAKPMTNPVTVYVTGTFGGGTVSIQVAPDVEGNPGTFVEMATHTANGITNIFVFGRYHLKAVLTGSTNPLLTARTS